MALPWLWLPAFGAAAPCPRRGVAPFPKPSDPCRCLGTAKQRGIQSELFSADAGVALAGMGIEHAERGQDRKTGGALERGEAQGGIAQRCLAQARFEHLVGVFPTPGE